MKILIFSLAYYPHASGAEIAIKEITDRSKPEDIEFHMVTLRFSAEDAEEERVGTVFVHRVGSGASYLSKILFIPRAASLAIRLHSAQRFDALWAMMSYMVLPIVLMRLRNIKLPYVLTLQDGDPFEHVFGRPHILPFLPLLKKGFREASVVHVISNYLGDWARRMGYRGPLEVIPNGVDVARFSGEKIPHAGTVLITTSRLVQKNAIDDVIRSLKFLPESIVFRVLGSGSDEQALQMLAVREGVSERVEWMGTVDNGRLPLYLHAADIFVRPSRSEGLGTSFIEAMAAGLPVVATQEGGIADFLFDAKRNPEHPTTGWAVDVDSPEQIAQAIKDILGNPTQAHKVIENARALVREKYDWSLIAMDMKEKVFSKLFV